MIPDPKHVSPTPESIVIQILSEKPRQIAKDLYESFLQLYPSGMTIQGFYRILRKLTADRVLVKEGKLFSIDAGWIYNLQRLTDQLTHTYFRSGNAATSILLREGEEKVFTFENAILMDNFWTHALVTVVQYYALEPHNNKHGYAYTEHGWFQLLRTKQEEHLLEIYEKNEMEIYHVIGSHSFLDSLVPGAVGSPTNHVVIKTDTAFQPNMYKMVIGDFLFETALPKYIHGLLEKKFAEVASISNLNIKEWTELLSQPGNTILKIRRDKKQAEAFKKQITQIFADDKRI